MYLISTILFILVMFFISMISAEPRIFIDTPSLIVIIGLTLPLLFASGLFKDFLRGFAIMNQSINNYTAIELKRSLEAIKLATISILLSGILGTIVGFVAICSYSLEPEKFLPSMGVASLTTLYALIFILLLMPIQSKIKSILLTLEP